MLLSADIPVPVYVRVDLSQGVTLRSHHHHSRSFANIGSGKQLSGFHQSPFTSTNKNQRHTGRGLNLDYAYIAHEDLGDTHRFSLSLTFASIPQKADAYDYVEPSELGPDSFGGDD